MSVARNRKWSAAMLTTGWTALTLLILLLHTPLVVSSEEFIGKPKEEVCSSIDIRNTVADFERLKNCTVIEGYLQVLLIHRAEPEEYANLTFPKLREITGYLLFFRVKNLKSLRSMFPNLAVIRGSEVFHNYALVIYEMFELEEIGLRALTDIMRGAVRIEKNPRLCYVDSIDWDHIAAGAKGAHFFRDNIEKSNECPNTCPEGCSVLPNKGPLCWTQKDCQKKCDKSCGQRACMTDKSDCCHEACAGGCWNSTLAGCHVCRQYSFEQRCTTKSCPTNTFEFFGRRCLNANECKSMAYKPFNGSCELDCPTGYHTDLRDNSTCVRCEKECPKECPGSSVTNIADAQKLKGCTIIKGDLEIQISGAHDVVRELQANLNMITEIQGQLKVIRSFPIMSLNFLSSLRRIEGKKDTKQEAENYALYVLDNQNLEELWNWKVRKTGLEIGSGKLFFHFNPKLCIDKIRELEQLTRINRSDTRDVSPTSNGDRTACKVKKLNLTVVRTNSEAAIIHFTNFLHLMDTRMDARSLLGYLVNYKEAGSGNVSMFDDADACASESQTWKVKDVSAAINSSVEIVSSIITNLKPFTRYAIYVKTYTVASEQFGGSSDIEYFTTESTVPTSPVNVRASSDAHDRLSVSWEPPKHPNGNITFYMVVGELEEYNDNFIYSTDYCGHVEKMTTTTPTPEVPKDGSALGPLGGGGDYNGTGNGTFRGEGGEKCCACPKDKTQVAREEQEHMFRIQFENFLHNRVYVKWTDNAALAKLRKKRDISNEVNGNAFNVTLSGPYVTASSIAFEDPLSKGPANATALKNSTQVHSFVHVWYGTSGQVDNAKHFSSYTIKVRACQGTPNLKQGKEVNVEDVESVIVNATCSQESITTVKTAAKPGADNINVTTVNVTVSTKSSGSVFVKWEAPADPNGLILKFDVETRRVDGNHYPTVTCVTYKKYLNASGIDLTSLSAGNYSLRLSATTLWRSGEWSEATYFYIREPPLIITPAIIAGIVAAVILFVVVIMLTAVVYVKKRERQLPDTMHYLSVNPEYLPAEDVYVVDDWEVPREKITILRELGQGSFGMVYEGEARDIVEDKPVVRCAVKTVNITASHRERIEFLNEASVMKDFNCHHVVRLLGVVSMGQPTYVVMELMFHGDLKTYLRLHRPDECPGKSPPSVKRILQMAIEIADGMAYLADKKYVHRDLAARNCMVAEDLTVKIGDFGMTRDIYETDYYRKGGKGLLPVRWMAPESLKDGVFSSQSDVWSFGVVLWEMATLASQPYQGLSNEQVLKYVMDGGIMEKPEGCLMQLYDLMGECWSYVPKFRPTFMQLIERLLPSASASFSEVSFYQQYLDRGSDRGGNRDGGDGHEGPEATLAAADPDPSSDSDDDGANAEPSTPLRSQREDADCGSTAAAAAQPSVTFVPKGDHGEEARVEVDLGHGKVRSRPRPQRPAATTNGGSKVAAGTPNGVVANGRAGAPLVPYEVNF